MWAMKRDAGRDARGVAHQAGRVLLVWLLPGLAGCGNAVVDSASHLNPEAQTSPQPERQDGMTALEIVEKMLAVYGQTDTYVDNAEYAEHFVFKQDGVARQGLPMTVAVMLKRPDRFRLLRLRQLPDGSTAAAVVTCDGEKLQAQVSSLEPQLLELPAPDSLTLESIAPDPLLAEALFPVPLRDVFPQLELLLAGEGETPWVLEAKNRLVLLPPKKISPPGEGDVDCYRVQMPTSAGPQVCFIQKEQFLLRRIEIQNEALQKEMYPDHEFHSFRWQFDFYDIALDPQLPKALFQIDPPEKAEIVDKLEAREESGDEPSNSSAPDAGETDAQPLGDQGAAAAGANGGEDEGDAGK